MTVALCYLLAECAITADCEVKSLVSDVEGKADIDIRMRISDHGLVILVHYAVTVDIHELEVAGLETCTLERVCDVAVAIGCDILLEVSVVLDDSVSLVAVEVADRIAHLGAVKSVGILGKDVLLALDEAFGICDAGNLVLVLGEGEGSSVRKVLVDNVIPGEQYLEALVAYFSAVDERSFCTENLWHRSIYEPVFGALVVPVEAESETAAEQPCIETEVKLLRGLPGNVRIGNDVRISSHCRSILVGRIIRSVEGVRGQVLERLDVAVSVLPPAAADFEEVEPAGGLLHELLVAYYPAGGD